MNETMNEIRFLEPGVTNRPTPRTSRLSPRALLDRIRNRLLEYRVARNHPDHRKIKLIMSHLRDVEEIAMGLQVRPSRRAAQPSDLNLKTFTTSTAEPDIELDVAQGTFLEICQVITKMGNERM